MSVREWARSRFAIARIDDEGRQLLLPWRPFSRAAYVVPDAQRADEIGRRLVTWLLAWAFVMATTAFVRRSTGLYGALDMLVVLALAVSHYVWMARRATRGLERVRYQPPAG